MPGPFEGVKILEVAEFVAMPSAIAIMADWGAEVVKIENPQGGDSYRGLTSFGGVALKDVPIWFEQSNRNKRSVTIDLWKEEGREILYKLVKDADVFVTNFTIPVVNRFEIDYETLSKLNPRIVYGSLTGYGKNGPEKDKPGYDFAAFWAKSGIMSRLGEPGTPPPTQRGALGDNLTAGFIAGAVAAALYSVEKTGEGQAIDFSLFHYGVWGLSLDIMTALNQAEEIPRTERKKAPNPLWNTYETKDGIWLQLVCLQSDRYWPQFCVALGIEDLRDDSRFNSHETRDRNSVELISIIESKISEMTYEELEKAFSKAGEIIYSRVHTPLELVEDPQALANDFFAELEHPVGKNVKYISTPARFSKTPASIRSTAPELGQHTEEVLIESGYTWEEIIAFKDKQIIL